MAEHPWPQAVTPVGEQTETDSVERDDRHESPALISVAKAEDNGLKHNSSYKGVTKRGKLPLEISAKDDFLAEAGSQGHQDPKNHFRPCLRHHGAWFAGEWL